MYTLLIGVVLSISVALFIAYKFKRDDYFELICLALIIGIGFSFIVAMCIPTKTITNVTSLQIESLHDRSSLEGSFFLGCGKINEVMKYSMYIKKGDEFNLIQIQCDQASIKYSNGIPSLITFEDVPAKGFFINKFSIWDKRFGRKRYLICIPFGSIKNDYTL